MNNTTGHIGQTAALLAQVQSMFKHKGGKGVGENIVYGNKGEKVKVLAEHGEVLIVEKITTGQRFAAPTSSVDIKQTL